MRITFRIIENKGRTIRNKFPIVGNMGRTRRNIGQTIENKEGGQQLSEALAAPF